MNCNYCNTTLTGNFCNHCGRPAHVERVDLHYIVHEIQHVLHFEKGILRTVRDLLLRPGESINEFISIDRSRLVKPVLFLVVTSLIYTTLEHFFHIEQGYVDYNGLNNSTVNMIFSWIQEHYGYTNIIMCVFIALWLKLLFKSYRYNLFEILIMLCFVVGMGMLMFSIFLITEGLTHIHLLAISGVISFIYSMWAIGQFFNGRRVSSYLKAIASYLLGVITFILSVFITGMLVDLLRNPV